MTHRGDNSKHALRALCPMQSPLSLRSRSSRLPGLPSLRHIVWTFAIHFSLALQVKATVTFANLLTTTVMLSRRARILLTSLHT